MIEGRNTVKVDGVEMSIEFIAMLLDMLDGAIIKTGDDRVIAAKRYGDEFKFVVLSE